MATSIFGVRLHWNKLTKKQRFCIKRKVEANNEERRCKHLYLVRLRKRRMKSNDPYIVVPRSRLKPSEVFLKVWRRLGKTAYTRRRILLHHVVWELYGIQVNGDRQVIKLLNGNGESCSTYERDVLEDFASALSTGFKMRGRP